jgi:hypothetical protein
MMLRLFGLPPAVSKVLVLLWRSCPQLYPECSTGISARLTKPTLRVKVMTALVIAALRSGCACAEKALMRIGGRIKMLGEVALKAVPAFSAANYPGYGAGLWLFSK